MTPASLARKLPPRLYYCPPEKWPNLAKTAGEAGLSVVEIALAGGLTAALRQMAADLHFPAWFGNNLDALHDILTDPAWHQMRPQLIHITSASEQLSGEALESLLAVLESAMEGRRQENVPLWVVTAFAASGAAHLP